VKRSKRYREVAALVDREKLYSPYEAVQLVKETARARFDETVEVAFRLGVDPRKADQVVRGTISLPHGTGRQVRVAVFAAGEKAREALEAGADVVGAQDLVERVQQGFLDFDAAVATPEMMPAVGRLGKILGPRGLMPNPKAGTVTSEVGKAVREIKAGKVEYRTDRYGNVHVAIGKASFTPRQLLENFIAAAEEIIRAKPPAAKGKYIRRVTLATTMGPGIRVDPARLREVPEELAS
jgi:large subunit ribosomal protein L1